MSHCHTGAKASLRQHFGFVMFFFPSSSRQNVLEFVELFSCICLINDMLEIFNVASLQLRKLYKMDIGWNLTHPAVLHSWNLFKVKLTLLVLTITLMSFMTSNQRLISAWNLGSSGSDGRLNRILVGWFKYTANQSVTKFKFRHFHLFWIMSNKTTFCRCCSCVFKVFFFQVFKWSLTIRLP